MLLTQIMAGSIPIQQYFGHIVQESNDEMEVSTTLMIFGVVCFSVGKLVFYFAHSEFK